MCNVIQRLTFPVNGLCSDTELYFRLNPYAWFQYSFAEIHFSRHGEAQFDTYFNSFSVWKWKQHTSIDSLIFRASSKGKFLLRFLVDSMDSDPRVIHETIVESHELEWHEVELPYEKVSTGMLYLQALCLSDQGKIANGNFVTRSQPQLKPRTGLVITTYNREKYVRGNLARLEEAVSRDPMLLELLHVVVVDNASNLDLPSGDFITYIQNKNLGGAGGFSRGLVYLREQGEYSHALFMDDDISFDAESVCRAIMFVAYARDAKLCVSGAMFEDFQQHVQFEAGASFIFDNAFRQLQVYGAGMDMRDPDNVVLNDSNDRPVRYAAWWFFLFPISLSGDDLAFPFFVRGDDILFSYKYAKTIVTLNGVCVWHESFDYKDSATTLYYNQRNWEVLRAVAGPDSLGVWPALGHFLQSTLRENLSYRYVTAAYRIQAMRDFMQGPSYWIDLDAPNLNAELRSGDTEKAGSLTIDPYHQSYDYYGAGKRIGILGKALAIFTLYGHLIPGFMLQKLQENPMRALPFQGRCMSGIFGQRKVLYWHKRTNEGFVAEHSKKKFFQNLIDITGVSISVLLKYQKIRRAYRREYKNLVSPANWESYFGGD